MLSSNYKNSSFPHKSFLNLFGLKKTHEQTDANHEDAGSNSSEHPIAHKHLHFLNTVLRAIIEHPGSAAPFSSLLNEIESLTNATASALFLTKESGDYDLIAITQEAELDLFKFYIGHISIDDHYNAIQSDNSFKDELCDIKIIRLCENDSYACGTLILKIPKTISAKLSINDINSIKIALGGILSSSQQVDLSKRLALREERALIARELHDSLAQSLSYLKIQVSRLQSLLKTNPLNGGDGNATAINGIVEELRTNLNISYKQLRELITTFRLALNSRDLAQALEDSIEEFENRSSVAINLDNRLSRVDLSVDQEIHVLQVIREAVSNVVRHSQASHADVALNIVPQGTICITIDDDGIGIDKIQANTHRHGMIIMQQRAHELGGKYRVQKSHLGGTRIKVTFTTKNNKKISDIKESY